jgi:transposase-like protein
MKRYPAEFKEWVVEQMMPPLNRSVVELAKETGVTTVSLRTWRHEAREQGRVVPGNGMLKARLPLCFDTLTIRRSASSRQCHPVRTMDGPADALLRLLWNRLQVTARFELKHNCERDQTRSLPPSICPGPVTSNCVPRAI